MVHFNLVVLKEWFDMRNWYTLKNFSDGQQLDVLQWNKLTNNINTFDTPMRAYASYATISTSFSIANNSDVYITWTSNATTNPDDIEIDSADTSYIYIYTPGIYVITGYAKASSTVNRRIFKIWENGINAISHTSAALSSAALFEKEDYYFNVTKEKLAAATNNRMSYRISYNQNSGAAVSAELNFYVRKLGLFSYDSVGA